MDYREGAKLFLDGIKPNEPGLIDIIVKEKYLPLSFLSALGYKKKVLWEFVDKPIFSVSEYHKKIWIGNPEPVLNINGIPIDLSNGTVGSRTKYQVSKSQIETLLVLSLGETSIDKLSEHCHLIYQRPLNYPNEDYLTQKEKMLVSISQLTDKIPDAIVRKRKSNLERIYSLNPDIFPPLPYK